MRLCGICVPWSSSVLYQYNSLCFCISSWTPIESWVVPKIYRWRQENFVFLVSVSQINHIGIIFLLIPKHLILNFVCMASLVRRQFLIDLILILNPYNFYHSDTFPVFIILTFCIKGCCHSFMFFFCYLFYKIL